MQIESLAEFATLASTLNYRQTAAEHFISKSALSKHIHDLEDQLGVVLFERDTHSVVLTKDGARLYAHALKILDAYHEMCVDVQQRGRDVCLGASIKFPFVSQLISDVITLARQQMSELDIRVLDIGFGENAADLLDKGCDIVLLTLPPGGFENRLLATPLLESRAHVWVSGRDPLAGRERISLSDLVPMVCRSVSAKDTLWDRALKSQLARYDFMPHMGEMVDDMYRLNPGEYSFVYAGVPSSSFGFDSVMVPLAEELVFTLVAVSDRNQRNPGVANVLRVLQYAAKGLEGGV